MLFFFFRFHKSWGEKPTLFSFHDDINFCVAGQLRWSTRNLAYPFAIILFHFSVHCRWCSCSESIQRGSGRNQESSSKQHIRNNLTGQYICIIYQLSTRSRSVDIGQVLFLHSYGPRQSRGIYYMTFRTFMSLCAFSFVFGGFCCKMYS